MDQTVIRTRRNYRGSEMRLRRLLGGVLLALFAFTAWVAAPSPVQAEPARDAILWSARNDGWSAIRISQGCYLLFYKDGFVDGWGGYRDPELDVSVDGQCGPGGLAEGSVTLDFVWRLDTGEQILDRIEGTAHVGLLQGNATSSIADRDGDGWALRDLGDVRNPMPSFFRDGCEYDDEGDGNFVHPADEACHPEGATAMVQQLVAAGLIGGGGTATAPTPAPAPASASNADVWTKCISLAAEPKIGIQDEWSLTNRCPQPVIVRYCFKPNTPAAGDRTLCMRSEYATQEIGAGSKLDFPFTLVEEGDPMADGTIAGPAGLTVLGFACTGGSFPDVYFEDGQFKSFGC